LFAFRWGDDDEEDDLVECLDDGDCFLLGGDAGSYSSMSLKLWYAVVPDVAEV
jgi:hypothetical protein